MLVEAEWVLRTTKEMRDETSAKNTTLYFNFLICTKDMITHKFELVEKYYGVFGKLKLLVIFGSQ